MAQLNPDRRDQQRRRCHFCSFATLHHRVVLAGAERRPARQDSGILRHGLANNDALVGNVKQSNVLAVLTATDFNHREGTFELASDFDIALHDNGVSEKSTSKWTKAQIGVAVFQFEVINIVTPMAVSSAIIRYSDPRKSSLNSGASASSNPDRESMTTRFACIRLIILIKSCKVSSIDKSRERVLITPLAGLDQRRQFIVQQLAGLFSNAAITPGSPRRTPSARNSVARMVFPEPDGPTRSSE